MAKRFVSSLVLAWVLVPAVAAAEVRATIAGPATVPGNLEVTGALDVMGVANVKGAVRVTGSGGSTGIQSSAGAYGLDAVGNVLGARVSNTAGNAQLQLVPGTSIGPRGTGSGLAEAGTFYVDAAGALWFCTVGGDPGTWVRLGQSTNAIPAGTLMFFNLISCPAGWSEVLAARGRVTIGLPEAGALGGLVGTPLTDREDRRHVHPVTASTGNAVVTAHRGSTCCGYNDSGYFITDTERNEHHGDQHNHQATGTSGLNTGVLTYDSGFTPYLQLLTCQKT